VKAIQKLVENYMATAVLCTATQPPLERWMEPLRVREIYPDYETAYERLKRTQISNIGDISEEELVAGILSYRQCLVIVNRRKDAQDLYQRMGEEGTFHLSTYMTPMDRKQTLYVIKERLQHQQICRVVSTSLVEAGVDIDFPVVYRELTGLDSIIQAAGRCNREAKRSWEDSTVFVFRLHEPPKTIQKNVAITEETFLKFQKLDGLDTMQYYFTTIQNLDPEGLDQYGILDAFAKGLDGVKLPFKRVSDDFRLIHSGTKMVIIPVDEEAKDLLRILEAKIANKDRFGSVLRKVSVYAINLYDYEYRKLLDAGNIYELLDGVGVLQILSLYTRERGLQYVEEEGMNVLLL
jgi:CRISPR-associated endonuclease/helicase Cas3